MAMPRRKQNSTKNKIGGGDLGFEAKLWQAADGLRNNTDAVEYKHFVLGLFFLKYTSDAFKAKHALGRAYEYLFQESSYTTRRLARTNLAIRGIDVQIAHGDTVHTHGHPALKAD